MRLLGRYSPLRALEAGYPVDRHIPSGINVGLVTLGAIELPW